MNSNTTKRLAYTAVLAALCAIANVLTIPLGKGSNYLTFTYTICFLAGVILGPIEGLTVGFLGDLIGHLIHPMGVYNPIIGLASGLLGLIPALVFRIPKLRFIFKLILSLSICLIVCTAGINTYALWLIYGAGKKTFWVYLAARLPFQVVMVVVNGILIGYITPVIQKQVEKLG